MTSLQRLSFLIVLFGLNNTFASDISYKGDANPTSFWTGLYGGLNVGATNHTMNITDVNASSFLATIEQVSDPQFTGGLQIGYRHQIDLMPVTTVFGAELSANFSNVHFSKDYGSEFSLYNLSSENSIKTVCLLELIGGIATSKTLLFLAAGVSWANIDGSTDNLDSVVFFDSFSVDKHVWGGVLGAGIEYAFWKNFSARIKVDVVIPGTYETTNDTGYEYQIANQLVQGTFAVNYKFL